MYVSRDDVFRQFGSIAKSKYLRNCNLQTHSPLPPFRRFGFLQIAPEWDLVNIFLEERDQNAEAPGPGNTNYAINISTLCLARATATIPKSDHTEQHQPRTHKRTVRKCAKAGYSHTVNHAPPTCDRLNVSIQT